jgi:hypothetical protein
MARITKCTCDHIGIEHYDSFLFCMAEGCDCEQFVPNGPEISVQVGKPMPRA